MSAINFSIWRCKGPSARNEGDGNRQDMRITEVQKAHCPRGTSRTRQESLMVSWRSTLSHLEGSGARTALRRAWKESVKSAKLQDLNHNGERTAKLEATAPAKVRH